jgi:hypothetical protein
LKPYSHPNRLLFTEITTLFHPSVATQL